MDFNEHIMNDSRIKHFLSENIEEDLHLFLTNFYYFQYIIFMNLCVVEIIIYNYYI